MKSLKAPYDSHSTYLYLGSEGAAAERGQQPQCSTARDGVCSHCEKARDGVCSHTLSRGRAVSQGAHQKTLSVAALEIW
jgi:hypothetical protein